ncbi:histidine kinase [Lysobacter sp. S4-A87]|uniref:sensor histidine kinase n=1 Tax=Lysobacter sp. S4-A87 TaxID=2925843 RepID=UPI001F52EA1D|nr:histidine kinase [Lysobacter sp. S4-A87]UNK50599.1 histidine kinase [Lysobacter sp. S4-A87]
MPKSQPAHSPLDALWQPSAILWTMLSGEAVALLLALAPGMDEQRLRYFALVSVAIQWMLLWSIATLYLLRRPLRSLPPQRIAYVVLAILLISTWAITAAIGFFFRDGWNLSAGEWRWTQWRLIGMVMTVGALGVAVFQSQWRARQLALRAKQLELEALQARIRPHFLFNTLNTGAALVHRRPEEVERLLLDLADLFRAALAGPRDISLEDELALARRYLEIESLRFGERLQVNWKLPRELPPVTVPALSIQPLVENAIRHGIERRPGGGEIEIAVTTTPETVIVRIINPLPPSGQENRLGHQVGLNASQVRIEAFTSGRGSVHTQLEGKRFIATVRLPVAGAPD